jgi:hypothetical protein
MVRDPSRRLVPPVVRVLLRLLGADTFLLLDDPPAAERR